MRLKGKGRKNQKQVLMGDTDIRCDELRIRQKTTGLIERREGTSYIHSSLFLGGGRGGGHPEVKENCYNPLSMKQIKSKSISYRT